MQVVDRAFKFRPDFLISSIAGFFSKVAKTAAVCPSETGTRRHWEVMTGLSALTMTPFSICPQSFKGSCSLFSSSPPMYGMTLSRISGKVSKVLPAPEIAW